MVSTPFVPSRHGYAFKNSWLREDPDTAEIRAIFESQVGPVLQLTDALLVTALTGTPLAAVADATVTKIMSDLRQRLFDGIISATGPSTMGLCGGMAFSAFDYYWHGWPISRRSDNPTWATPDGAELRGYIWRRLHDSLTLNGTTFLDWMVTLHLVPIAALLAGQIISKAVEEVTGREGGGWFDGIPVLEQGEDAFNAVKDALTSAAGAVIGALDSAIGGLGTTILALLTVTPAGFALASKLSISGASLLAGSFALSVAGQAIRVDAGGTKELVRRCRDEWDSIRRLIDSGAPVVVGLVGTSPNPLDNHQVIAVGYDTAPNGGTLLLWDNNDPNVTSPLSFSFGAEKLETDYTFAGNPVVGFFAERYEGAVPPLEARFGAASSFAASRARDQLDVFWVGPDSGVGTTWWAQASNKGNWNVPFPIAHGGSALPGPVAVISRLTDHLDVFWVAADGSIMSNWWNTQANNAQWNTPFPIAPAGAAQPGAVAAVARTPDHVDVFWIGPDGGVGSTWWDRNANNAQWNTPFPIAPAGAAQPGAVTAVARTLDHVDVFWIGPDGGVGSTWWDRNANNAQWNTPFPIAPAGAAQPGAVATVARTRDHVDVFWIGPDGGVGSNWWNAQANNAQWNTPFPIAPAGAAQPGAVAAVARTLDHVDVFWIGSDGGVGSNWWDAHTDSAAWHIPFPITPPSHAQSLSTPRNPRSSSSFAVARTATHLDVFWVGPDGGVGSTWWDVNANNALWNTPFPIAPAGMAQPGPVAVVSRKAGHLDIFWVAPDGAVMTNWWDAHANNALWNTPFPIAPPNAAGPASGLAAVTRTPEHLDVFWIGPDGGVGSTWWDMHANNALWNTPFPIAPPNAARPNSPVAAVARTPEHLDVFWVGPDGGVGSTWWDAHANNAAWNTPFPITSPGHAQSSGVSHP